MHFREAQHKGYLLWVFVYYVLYTRLTVLHEEPYVYFVFRSPRKMEKRKSKDLRKPFHVLFLSHISSVSVQRNAGGIFVVAFCFGFELSRATLWSLSWETDNLILSASNTMHTLEVQVFKQKLLSDLS